MKRAICALLLLATPEAMHVPQTRIDSNNALPRLGPEALFAEETVLQNLKVPWAIAFAPDGRMFFTERAGKVSVLEPGATRPRLLAQIPDVVVAGETGLMDLKPHTQFGNNHWLYLAYTYRAGGLKRVRVVRYKETGSALTERKVIIENIPASDLHCGTRLGFGPADGKLYITTGDASSRQLAQRLDRLHGKTLRLNDDGSVPSDNPFVNRPNARPEI
jgi:glucose/arabinose dehydrogenase